MFTDEELAGEEWRPVVGWEDKYEVSSLLRVRSIPRTIVRSDGIVTNCHHGFVTEKVGGYRHLRVRLYRNRIGTWHSVADCYASAFDKSRSDALELEKYVLAHVALNGNRVVFDSEDDIPGEEWRDIDGYGGKYQVSTEARVRVTERTRVDSRSVVYNLPRRILASCVTQGGRRAVVLSGDGKSKRYFVDTLVADAFLSRPNGCHFLKHVNGDESDCRLENIEWVELHPDIDVESLYDGSEAEEWRPVVGWEDLYVVSSYGRLMSLDRTFSDCNGKMMTRHGQMLSLGTNQQGYVIAALTRDKNVTYVGVHRLVAEAFLERPEGDCEVDHVSGVRNDNRASNLRYCTRAENTRNRVLDGSRKSVNKFDYDRLPEDLPDEKWCDIDGHEGYQVSSCGRVRSLKRLVNSPSGKRTVPGRLLRLQKNESGRMITYLSRPKKCAIFVDEAVALAFVPNTDEKEFVFHTNGDPSDSNVENLAWLDLDEINDVVTSEIRSHDTEEWVDIPGSRPMCQISASGSVRVPARVVRCAGYRLIGDRHLDVHMDEHGRRYVNIPFGDSSRKAMVDELLADTFLDSEDYKCAS